jgi:putative Mg2+ transporter-C (MgtC) family protein
MTTSELCCRLLLANLCGALIGINRDLHNKSAGFRTLSMVSVGSAIVTLTIAELGVDANAASRVVQGVVTGVGFLGAGLILHPAASNRVLGLTTAAAVWVTASLGLASGLGHYRLVTASLVLILAILVVGGPLEKYIERIAPRRRSAVDEGPDSAPPPPVPPPS